MTLCKPILIKEKLKIDIIIQTTFFDEIHFISLIDQDIDSSKIQKIVGNAKNCDSFCREN